MKTKTRKQQPKQQLKAVNFQAVPAGRYLDDVTFRAFLFFRAFVILLLLQTRTPVSDGADGR